jgi:hypothetical protein
MPTIPPNYPHGCSDDEILQVMQDVTTDLQRGGFDINHVLRISPIITVGQNEMQTRIAQRSSVELQSAIDTFRKSSDKASSTIIGLTKVLVGLTVALVLLTVALIVLAVVS